MEQLRERLGIRQKEQEAEVKRGGWGEGGDDHKLNISCLMYLLLIQFFTGEIAGVAKRTHEPLRVLPFNVDVVMPGEVDLFQDTAFDCCSDLRCIFVPQAADGDRVCR